MQKEQKNKKELRNFILKNFVKLILILGAIVGVLLLANYFLLKNGIILKDVLENSIKGLSTGLVLIIFYTSESILGWIPPDIFIVWAKIKPFDNHWINITLIATISYLGGITAYYLGTLIRRFPKVNSYVERKYAKNFDMIQKWGGVVIVLAALFPLPFATISTIAGIVNYPFKKFLIYGSTRYLRFYLYAAFIFWGIWG